MKDSNKKPGQPEQLKKAGHKNLLSGRTWLSIAMILVASPGVVLLSEYLGDRKYYLAGVLIIVFAMIPFFVSFEGRKPQPREMVSIAVLCTIAVVSRVAFIALPGFKPIIAVIIIAGMAFGAEAGFLTGAVGAFVSNFIFGQGPWTPWQMFAYGMAGFIAGLLTRMGLLKAEKRIPVTVFGGLAVLLVVGPILDTCTLFTMASMIDTSVALTVYLAGFTFNLTLAGCTMATLFLLCKPMMEKLDRIKRKYGMAEGFSGGKTHESREKRDAI